MIRKISRTGRIVLGLIYFIFGANHFYNFVPVPPIAEQAMPFLNGLGSAPYFYPLLKMTEVVCGFMLLSGIMAPLALVILAPITLQISMLHFLLNPGIENQLLGLTMAIAHPIAALEFIHVYRPMFRRYWPL